MPDRIWNYYEHLASIVGKGPDGEDEGYSVSWFYESMRAQRNVLTRAFLNEEHALDAIQKATETDLLATQRRVKEICGDTLYSAQNLATANSLLNDITIIQGPPGTGKTATIRSILLCVRELYPEAKIAVISANSEAINNAVDAIKDDHSLQNSYARLGNREARKKFYSHLAKEDPAYHAQLASCMDVDECLYPVQLLERYPIIFSTIHSLRKSVGIAEYDYVIVDECSQVPSFIGMIALASAKHLVLLGDDEQLPPIHKDKENNKIADVPLIRMETPWYLDEKGNSFMKACETAFGDRCGKILLNEHYRCHPAIIGFCNQYIYKNQLITRTDDDGKLPIRIRWYEGDYWEEILSDEETDTDEKKVNVNKKQIEVFVKDELPDILDILHTDSNYSICVLSPFRYQLKLLKNRLTEAMHEADVPIENELEEEQSGIEDLAQLTIHKAQGRGYDRVYMVQSINLCDG